MCKFGDKKLGSRGKSWILQSHNYKILDNKITFALRRKKRKINNKKNAVLKASCPKQAIAKIDHDSDHRYPYNKVYCISI